VFASSYDSIAFCKIMGSDRNRFASKDYQMSQLANLDFHIYITTSWICWSSVKSVMEFCMEDRIPRLIFSTHVFSGLDVHNSSIRPSWKENANGDFSKLVLNSPFVSASILFFGESGSDSNSLTLPSYKTTNYYSYEYCTLTFYLNIF
jgi:hypothetical protein